MTAPAHPQQEYIITEEQLQRNHEVMSPTGRKKYEKEIRSRPHSSAQSRDQVLDEAIGLLKDHLLWDIPHVMSFGIEHSIQTLEKLRTQESRDP